MHVYRQSEDAFPGCMHTVLWPWILVYYLQFQTKLKAGHQMSEYTVKPYGDSALIVSFEQRISPEILSRVTALVSAVRAASFPGVVDIIPAYCTVTVLFDPWVTSYAKMREKIASLDISAGGPDAEEKRYIDIPVLYGSPFPEDLSHVAANAGLTPEEVVAIHTANEYPVYMIGFLPGFPYLGNLDPRIHTPRRTSPREIIPAGSVGIGGAQTGIYPVDSPGGWHIIGKTPLKLYDPSSEDPLLLRCGDVIRFRSVTEDEFIKIEANGGRLCT